MKVTMETTAKVYQLDFPTGINEEGELWKKVAETLFADNFPVPNSIHLKNEDGTKEAHVEIYERVKNEEDDNIVIRITADTFRLAKSLYEQKLLRHVDAETNLRSRYNLNPNNMGPRTLNIGAVSGIIGKKGMDRLEDGTVHKAQPSQLYWLRYYQKLAAGFKDYTEELKQDEDESKISAFFKKPTVEETSDDEAVTLYRWLIQVAKETLSESGFEMNFYSSSSPYTRRQVTSARKLYNKMCNLTDATLFNGCIDDFIAIAAPKVGKNFQIKDFHVPTIPLTEEELFKQMEAKLDWVNKIVSSMEALVSQTHSKTEKFESPFGNVSVRKETPEEMEETIKEYKLSGKIDVVEVYDITPHDQVVRYEEYLKNGMFNSVEHDLFHGSANCNWVSIIKMGLLLNPNARICGKAFGNGSYFANNPFKSAGYCSSTYSRDRGIDGNISIMGVYRVATGNTYEPNGCIGGAPEKTTELLQMFKEKRYDSTWYHAGGGVGFRNDEIIVYNESASCLKKLIVFK
jgi:hypothetical protein